MSFTKSPKLILGTLLVAYILSNVNWLFAFAHLRHLFTPEKYHGKYLTENFFEGWYYKSVSVQVDGSMESLVLIPGIYRPPSARGKQTKENWAHAFIMLLRSNYDEVLYYRFPVEDFEGDKEPSDPVQSYELTIGGSRFWRNGVSLNLDPKYIVWITEAEYKEFANRAAHDWIGFSNKNRINPMTDTDVPKLMKRLRRGSDDFRKRMSKTVIKGTLKFSNQQYLPQSFMQPAAMGIFHYIPFLECYHNIPILSTNIQGQIDFGKDDFMIFTDEGGSGYVEKDHGFNFPEKYTWIQSSNFKQKGTTLSLSIATVAVLSPNSTLYTLLSKLPFLGTFVQRMSTQIGFLIKFHHPDIGTIDFNFNGLSSKVISIDGSIQKDLHQVLNIVVENGDYQLRVSAKRLLGSGLMLRGPKMAARDMILIVEETMNANVTVVLVLKGRKHGDTDVVLFEGLGKEGGMEILGDVENFI